MMKRVWGAVAFAALVVSAWSPMASAQLSSTQLLAGARPQAIQEVLAASRSRDPFLRSNAIEAMQSEPERVMPLLQLGLNDENPVVRFASLMSVGKLGLVELGPASARHLNDPSPSVRAAAVYAAKATGMDPSLNELPAMLTDENPAVRRNAAMVIGLMGGDRSTIEMLKDLARTPMPRADSAQQAVNRLLIAQAILRLGDEDTLDTIRAGVYSSSLEVRAEAITMLGEAKDYQMTSAFVPLLKDDTIEVRLAAATTLARLGRDDGLNVLLEGANFNADKVRQAARDYLREDSRSATAEAFRRLLNDPEQSEAIAVAVRSQSAFGLAQLRETAAAKQLIRMLDDPSQQVRVSAAAAILQSTSAPPQRASRH